MVSMVLNIDILLNISSKLDIPASKQCLGLSDVYQIGIGRCLQWNIVMDDDIGGAGLGACPKRECVCRKARKTNNAFHGATKAAILNSSLRAPMLGIFACLFLTHQLVRSELCAWTVFRLTCSLHSVHCSLLPEQGKYVGVYFTSEH